MRILSNSITLLISLIAVFLVSTLYLGISNQTLTETQPAYIGLLLYGGISTLLALIFGLLKRRATRKSRRSGSWIGGFAILSGSLGLLTLMMIAILG